MGEENNTSQPETQNISSLKAKLDELNTEKEKWFVKKEELKQKIADLIKEVREVKAKNDSLSHNIKEVKEKRDAQNAEVKRLIDEIKEINKKRDTKVTLDKKDPVALKRRIEKLTARIETGAVSFDDEKKCMKEIKQGLKDEIKKVNVDKRDQKQVQKKRKERAATERKEVEHKKLEEKKEKVEEKIKGKGKKILTTEDLIAFQGEEEEK